MQKYDGIELDIVELCKTVIDRKLLDLRVWSLRDDKLAEEKPEAKPSQELLEEYSAKHATLKPFSKLDDKCLSVNFHCPF